MDGKIKKLYKIVLTGGKNDPLDTLVSYYEFIVVTYCLWYLTDFIVKGVIVISVFR